MTFGRHLKKIREQPLGNLGEEFPGREKLVQRAEAGESVNE